MDLRNSIKRYLSFSQVLEQEHHVREHPDPIEFHLRFHVGRTKRPHVTPLERHVPQTPPSVPNRHLQGLVVHSVNVAVSDLNRHEHGHVDGHVRSRVDLDSVKPQPYDLEGGIGRPEEEGGAAGGC